MAAVLFAAHRDAQLDMDFSCHCEHSPDGVGADWRIRVAGGSAPPGAWNAQPAFGRTRPRRGTVAARQPYDPVANRHLSIHVFRRDEVLLHEGLLDKDGCFVSRPHLYFRSAA